MGHKKVICKKCGKVILQCRCMDCNKTTEYSICDDCKNHIADVGKMVSLDDVINIIRTFSWKKQYEKIEHEDIETVLIPDIEVLNKETTHKAGELSLREIKEHCYKKFKQLEGTDNEGCCDSICELRFDEDFCECTPHDWDIEAITKRIRGKEEAEQALREGDSEV